MDRSQIIMLNQRNQTKKNHTVNDYIYLKCKEKEKRKEMEQKNTQGPEGEPQVKQPSWLA